MKKKPAAKAGAREARTADLPLPSMYFSLFSGFFSLFIYALTLNRTLGGGDSGRPPGPPPLPLPATSAVEAQAATPDGQPWFYSYIRVCALLSLGLGVVAFLAGVVVFSTALASPRYMGEAWPLWLLAVSVLALLAGLFVAAALLLGLDAGESLRGLLRQGQARRRRPTEMAP
jgi:hypothetical protein